MVMAMKNLRETLYTVCSFHDVYFLDLVDKHESRPGKVLLDSVCLILRDPSYNVLRDREDANYQYDVSNLDSLAGKAARCKRMMTPGAHVRLVCSALQLAQWYNMLSKAGEEENSNSYECEYIAPMEVKDKMKTVFEVRLFRCAESEV